MDHLAILLSIKEYVDRAVANAIQEEASPAPEKEAEAISMDRDDFIDTAQAEERYGIPRDTIARWCDQHKIGWKKGGRWQVSIQATNRYLGRK